MDVDQTARISVGADIAWIPMVQSFVEKGAPVLGLSQSKTMMLTLAVEEIVAHLAGMARGTPVSIVLEPGGWHVRLKFSFRADPADLWAMNLVTGTDTREAAEHLGLVVASRAVDGFTLAVDGDTLHLTMRKDLDYPVVEARPLAPGETRGALTVVDDPEAELVKAACVKAVGIYPVPSLPQSFFTPGKVVDMMAQKDLSVAVAVDKAGALAGMICWQAPSARGVSFSGPYVFTTDPGAGALLARHLVGRVARTQAMGLFSELATAQLPQAEFESLGQVNITGEAGKKRGQTVWYRHLKEDVGAAVWAHRTFADFLETAYRQQVLMRDIRIIEDQGERLAARSVFSVRLRPESRRATLFPMVTGQDAAGCIARHVQMLRQENYADIFMRLDLAHGWQAAMGRAVMDNGFVPRLVLPYGGQSDILVFQHE